MKVRQLVSFNVWPVVRRELREAARRPANHRMRFWSGLVGTLVLVVVVSWSAAPAAQLGGWLFVALHALALGLIVLIVPGLTADCIAREKREGMLGLLFLTPLSASGIVAGKALAQALRAFTLWLAALPLLTIPFLTGGITWFDAYSAWSLEFCAAVLCLAAGLLASSVARERNTAFALAFLFAVIALFFFSTVFELVLFAKWRGWAFLGKQGLWEICWNPEGKSIFIGAIDTRGLAGWSSLSTLSALLARIWGWLCLISLPAVLVVFVGIARLAARRIAGSWQDAVPSPRRLRLLRRYCTPLFRRHFVRQRQRLLDWNLIVWLQQYSWKARIGKWGLCLAFLLIECVIPDYFQNGRYPTRYALWLMLGGIYTFAGVGSFLEERRSGALELLLVTPLSVNKLIYGRVWGLWKQFLPAGLLLGTTYVIWLWGNTSLFWPDLLREPLMLACGFLALPVFATYFALRMRNLVVAALLTWIALALPLVLSAAAGQLFAEVGPGELGFMPVVTCLGYAALALQACYLLRHSLSRRIYSF